MNKFLSTMKQPFMVTLALLLICGLAYPLLLTAISRTVFPQQAGGSLIAADGRPVGSILVGQDFTDQRFMKCRPSAVNYNTYTQADVENGNYAGIGSGSKNYGPTNQELNKRVQQDIAEFLEKNPSIKKDEIPTDLLTSSGSGLDPHISPKSAEVQIPALAEATGLSKDRLKEIVKESTQPKWLGIFGEETVNVLNVNLKIAKDLKLISDID